MVARARRNGLRIVGPSSIGIASARPDASLQAALVRVHTACPSRRDLDESGSLAGSFCVAPATWISASPGSCHSVTRRTSRPTTSCSSGGDTNTSVVATTRSRSATHEVRPDRASSSRPEPDGGDSIQRSASIGCQRAAPLARRTTWSRYNSTDISTPPQRTRSTAAPTSTDPRRHQRLARPSMLGHGSASACRTDPHRPTPVELIASSATTTQAAIESALDDGQLPRSSSSSTRAGSRRSASTSAAATSTGQQKRHGRAGASPCCSGSQTSPSCPARPCRIRPCRAGKGAASVTRMRQGVGWQSDSAIGAGP